MLSLNTLDYKSITPCTEFGRAASTWNSAVPNVTLSPTRTNIEVNVVAEQINVKAIAVTEIISYIETNNTKYVTESTIKFNTLKKWGDSNNWWHKLYRFDFQTTSLHELGHVLGLKEDSSSNLMSEYIPTWKVQRTIPIDDINGVKARFP